MRHAGLINNVGLIDAKRSARATHIYEHNQKRTQRNYIFILVFHAAHSTTLAHGQDSIDSVYFFVFPGVKFRFPRSKFFMIAITDEICHLLLVFGIISEFYKRRRVVYMTMKNMKHASKVSNRNFVIFILVFILAIGVVASAISYANMSAFAQVEASTSEPLAANPEASAADVTNPEAPSADVIDAEANDVAVTITYEGKGSITPTPEPISVASGTEFYVYGNELTIAGKTYTANVNHDYYFMGWYVDGTRVDVLGTITQATEIVAKFTSDETSCMVTGSVVFESEPYPSGFVYAISETSHKIVGGATFTQGAFTLRIPRGEAITLVSATSSYAILAGNSNAITSEQTSGATLDITSTPIELLAENPESCWLSGRFTCNGPVKNAAITCL